MVGLRGWGREVLEGRGDGTGDGSCQSLIAWGDCLDLYRGTA